MSDGRGGFILQDGVEVIDDWEGGCLIRADEPLPDGPGSTCFIVESDALVGLRLPSFPSGNGPFEYVAEKDRSDVRVFPVF